MRFELLLPLAPIVVTAPAFATTYLTVNQAQQIMFPGAQFTRDFRKLSDAQVKAIEKQSDAPAYSNVLKLWNVSSGGWFLVDRVLGKHEFITYALGLDTAGRVRDVEILDYRETHGEQVREPTWRAQFMGKHYGDSLKLGKDVRNISGATLSCKHISEGVRRLLATYHLIIKGS
jgi:Na+-translocating ferredoxin:NAD+ oxidoreductase RnfG subunit